MLLLGSDRRVFPDPFRDRLTHVSGFASCFITKIGIYSPYTARNSNWCSTQLRHSSGSISELPGDPDRIVIEMYVILLFPSSPGSHFLLFPHKSSSFQWGSTRHSMTTVYSLLPRWDQSSDHFDSRSLTLVFPPRTSSFQNPSDKYAKLGKRLQSWP